MDEILKVRLDDIPLKHKCEHDGYEYYRRELVPGNEPHQCTISVYEIPPVSRHIRTITTLATRKLFIY